MGETKKRRVAVLGGAVALTIVAGSLLGATAANADTGGNANNCLTTTGTTGLIGNGNGLINIGSTNGIVGISTGSGGLNIGLLNCVGATVTSTVPTTTPTVLPTTTPTTVPTTTPTTVPTPDPSTAAPTPAPTSTTTTTTPSSTPATTVKVTTSTTTVYPAAKGYKDKITFSIKGLTGKSAVKLTGTAVLKKGSKVVKTWKINGSTSKLSWNGKVGKKIVAGTYKLVVSTVTSTGVKKTTTTTVHVSAKHFVSRSAIVRSTIKASDLTSKMPSAVAKAFKYGKVTAQIRTVAVVHGSARLIFTDKKVKRVVVLKNGTHTTKALTVPKDFTNVTIKHDWKKGAATLISYVTTWRYRVLV